LIKTSDFIADFLVKKKITQIFGVTGGGAMHLNNSFGINKSINFIYTHHEQSASMAADAYFREKRIPAAVNVTSGPGGTNAITGVIGAWIDSIPMLVISGQVPTNQLINKTKTRQIGVQEANIIEIVKSFTKYSVLIKDSKNIKYEMEKCHHLMLEGRPGPVWIDIPLDVQSKLINIKTLKSFKPNYKIFSFDKKFKIFFNLINKSKKPLIIIGNGIHISNAKKKFLTILKKLQFPVISSWNASDIINSDDELYIGRMGIFGDRASNFAAQNSDLMIILGSRLSVPQVGYLTKDFAKKSEKIIVDIDQFELNKNLLTNVKLKIKSDLKKFLEHLDIYIKKKNIKIEHKKFYSWKFITRDWKIKYPVLKEKHDIQEKFTNSFNFIDALSKVCKGNETIVTDMGTSFTCTMQAFNIKKNLTQRLFTSSGLAAMGFGIPGAIGAYFANPKKNIICLSGDGGMMFNMQEFQTVKHYNMPIKFFILENKGYLTMKLMQKKNFKKFVGSNTSSGISIPDIKKIAYGFGIKYFKLGNKSLIKKIDKILQLKHPVITEVNMNEFQSLIPRIQNKLLKDGSFKTVQFDDLYPHLSETELQLERKKAIF
jgi:acetolactate synthase-1/2/3 large subunit